MKLKDNQKKNILERLKKKKELVKVEMKRAAAGANAEATHYVRDKEAERRTDTSKNESNLSKLQQKMQKKLKGAQFRWINEKLYTSKSQDAVELMKEKPELFDVVLESYIHLRYIN